MTESASNSLRYRRAMHSSRSTLAASQEVSRALLRGVLYCVPGRPGISYIVTVRGKGRRRHEEVWSLGGRVVVGGRDCGDDVRHHAVKLSQGIRSTMLLM